MPQIHPTSLVDPHAEIADGVVIGPFCIVGPGVRIGAGTVLRSHVVVDGSTEIGERNLVYAGASIGCAPQDKKYRGEDTRLVVGDDNVIRENCTLSIGTIQDEGITRVGSRNLFMANAHVAHDCRVGDDVILANNVALAGHVTVGSHAILGGQSAVHQFARVGEFAMVGGQAGVLQDVPPYVMSHLNPAKVAGLNLVGLRRAGFTDEQIRALRKAYGHFYRENLTVKEAAEKIAALKTDYPGAVVEIDRFLTFVTTSQRGVIR